MHILTPSEQREVEKTKRDIINVGGYTGDDAMRMAITITPKNYELWLNILDMALQTNEAMREAWQHDLRITLADSKGNVIGGLEKNV